MLKLLIVASIAIIVLLLIRNALPVSSLKYLDTERLRNQLESIPNLKLLDVRDASEYEKCHVLDSINLSLGRLPYIWDKELTPNDAVLILSGSLRQSKKAARILNRSGFSRLFAFRDNDIVCNRDISHNIPIKV